ncbi:hypothetical protein [Lysobacter sp. Root690]|uniref:hypothetical protein n=1 Tax=Lysobacter sp. Root690 TaxID=1736588 RepID=UPI0012F95832|nr:hypothetical protein [Lysobacter sp. Root690]
MACEALKPNRTTASTDGCGRRLGPAVEASAPYAPPPVELVPRRIRAPLSLPSDSISRSSRFLQRRSGSPAATSVAAPIDPAVDQAATRTASLPVEWVPRRIRAPLSLPSGPISRSIRFLQRRPGSSAAASVATSVDPAVA